MARTPAIGKARRVRPLSRYQKSLGQAMRRGRGTCGAARRRRAAPFDPAAGQRRPLELVEGFADAADRQSRSFRRGRGC